MHLAIPPPHPLPIDHHICIIMSTTPPLSHLPLGALSRTPPSLPREKHERPRAHASKTSPCSPLSIRERFGGRLPSFTDNLQQRTSSSKAPALILHPTPPPPCPCRKQKVCTPSQASPPIKAKARGTLLALLANDAKPIARKRAFTLMCRPLSPPPPPEQKQYHTPPHSLPRPGAAPASKLPTTDVHKSTRSTSLRRGVGVLRCRVQNLAQRHSTPSYNHDGDRCRAQQ